MATYTLAFINNHEDRKLFFDTYNIPYQVITKGVNTGKLRVKQPRSYVAGEIYLPGCNVEISDLSIYGYGTKTIVIRAM